MEVEWSLFKDRYDQLIPEFDKFIESLHHPFPIGLRENKLLQFSQDLESDLKIMNPSYKRPVSSLNYFEVDGERKEWGGHLDHHLGRYFMQARSSLIPVELLSPGQQDRVWDVCAAPGGKTTHLAEKMANQGILFVSEPDLQRRRILKANCNRMGVRNHFIFEGPGQDQPFKSETFDKILLDGPCSSEGTFREDVIFGTKRRKVNYLKYHDSFRRSLHKEQRELILFAFDRLRVGGDMVYSTCTYDPQENEAIVDFLLKERPSAFVCESILPDDFSAHSGVSFYDGQKFHKDCEKTFRFYPHTSNSIGFYAAKITKR